MNRFPDRSLVLGVSLEGPSGRARGEGLGLIRDIDGFRGANNT
jgi:hypothetical protein